MTKTATQTTTVAMVAGIRQRGGITGTRLSGIGPSRGSLLSAIGVHDASGQAR